MPLLTLTELQENVAFFRSAAGARIGKMLMHWLNVDKVNSLYDRHPDLLGPDFASVILKDVGLEYEIIHSEILSDLPEGPFVVIANHPYGSLDGVMLIDIFGHIRQDFKLMVNGFLSRVESLDSSFIKVTPTGDRRSAPTKESLQGVREAIGHVHQGHPLAIFPSGAVSDLSLHDRCISDREWQEPAIRLIKKLRVPIVPVHFLDGNSAFYYALGLLDWRIRLLRLPSEIFNKRGKTARVAIGPIIPVSAQDSLVSVEEFREYLRDEVYNLSPS